MSDDLLKEYDEFLAARQALLGLGREQSRLDAIEAVSRLVDEAEDLGSAGAQKLQDVADGLQKRRAFALLLVLCLMAGRAGLATPALKQKEVQALIELGRLSDAVREAKRLADSLDGFESPAAEKVWASAMGNVGRTYKQLYINAAESRDGGDPDDLLASVQAYRRVWDRGANPDTTYHGVNAAALIMRGVRDQAGAPGWAKAEDARRIAETILDIHKEDLRNALSAGSAPGDIWTLATCGEAFLVLGMLEDAAQCYGAYAGNPANSAFNLASSLRQLREVWGYSGETRDTEGSIVRMLKAALLNVDAPGRPGGSQAAEDDLQTESVVMSVTEARLIETDLGEGQETGARSAGFEAYFGKHSEGRAAGAMVDIQRLMGAVQRARSLCAIERMAHGGWERIGTGFVVRGELLSPAWEGRTLIVTNHHVAADSDAMMSSSFKRCRAVFVDLDPNDGVERQDVVEFAGLVWASPHTRHDTAVLEPAGALPSGAMALSDDDFTDYLPKRRDGTDGTDMHVVILGFPGGGELKLSFGDELLLDHDASLPGHAPKGPPGDGRPVRLHYRTPSLPGSSGSPVFEAGTWRLIGIHHRGRPDTPRLPPKQASYEANEGVWLASIRAAIAADQGGAENFQIAHVAATLRRALGAASALQHPRAPENVPSTDEDIVFGQPIGGPAAMPAAAQTHTAAIPGHYVPKPADSEEVARRYLRTGRFHGDLEAFRTAGTGFETVIGDDNRTQIHDTDAYPFRMICSLTMTHEGGLMSVGTGFLIGRRTLITAGHCLQPNRHVPPLVKVEVRPGRAGLHEPFAGEAGPALGTRFSLHREWSNRYDPNFDVGAIHLDTDIGEQLGWFGVRALSPSELELQWAHVTGYPGDKVIETGEGQALPAAEMWHHATPLTGAADGRVFYPADTFAGQSGAPVYRIAEDGRAEVVAIHAYGIDPAGGPLAHANNSGVLVDGALLQVLSDWRVIG